MSLSERFQVDAHFNIELSQTQRNRLTRSIKAVILEILGPIPRGVVSIYDVQRANNAKIDPRQLNSSEIKEQIKKITQNVKSTDDIRKVFYENFSPNLLMAMDIRKEGFIWVVVFVQSENVNLEINISIKR